MQPMVNLCATHGVPLCVSGITNPLALAKEMEDHERRRKAMKMQRSVAMHANANDQLQRRNYEIMFMADLDDLIIHHLFYTHLHLTAKAA
ncbi:uncharacterized protein LOC109798337 [Cajanus cajan]|uniref:uncharacterized protein LOC109798337 n=1 Tax=Cajanus cajan TaxID=3821 RepID=UPI00098DAE2A|nr:uncharacterized protein LOC109798337 [Cajanus cajan]